MTTPYEFCTLLDVNYLPRGLVLYRSLAEACSTFRLRIFCMDEMSYELLTALALPGVTAIPLGELERHDAELASVKEGRTQLEYCWTATPCIALYTLEHDPELEVITYLDADLRFYAEPAPLFEEFGDRSVLLVPHRSDDVVHKQSDPGGVFNVQFMTFRSDAAGLEALRWWRARCIEWCYARFEDGKFGDQQYLDDWPTRFPRVHVLQHPGGGLAPWNASRYRIHRRNGAVYADEWPVVFYHYQSLQLYSGPPLVRHMAMKTSAFCYRPHVAPLTWSTNYSYALTRTRAELELIWDPYLRELAAATAEIEGRRPGLRPGVRNPLPVIFEEYLRVAMPPVARRGLARLRRSLAGRGRSA